MKLILLILLAFIIIIWLIGWVRTYKTQHSANEARFLAGTLPSPMPNGFYKGKVTGYHGSWQGKKFDTANHTGINVFNDSDSKIQERYPFVTYSGYGIRDKSTQVFKIDYAKAKNPWYAKLVLDEIVQTAPGSYLGKIHLRILPGVSFAVGYFTLTQ